MTLGRDGVPVRLDERSAIETMALTASDMPRRRSSCVPGVRRCTRLGRRVP